ncbi:hypothetical protein LEN26_000893 [Aphanomyces euteiches]|nr:hypothetical protein AeMF1_010795 [Aphanomyces euteiches]KAH9162565.1 hypothetical protein LEN26_000893 [Aphanomyces euteiches]KAH9192435.1 hypothetical protein AeNC1_005589 [Aphanomyces euteiches]
MLRIAAWTCLLAPANVSCGEPTYKQRESVWASDASPMLYSASLPLSVAETVTNAQSFSQASRIHVVESLPVGDFELLPLPGSKNTAEALVELIDSALHRLDIFAMYWNLLGEEDRGEHSPEEMRRFGVDRGVAVFNAIERAIQRGVPVRVIGSSNPAFAPKELDKLQVQLRLWNSSHWYGGGIMHQKMVIADGQHAYVGSANMDWKSLAQVMEVGVVIESTPAVVEDMARLFELWWLWSGPTAPLGAPVDVFVEKFQCTLHLPRWSSFVPPQWHQPSPFSSPSLSSSYNKDNPMSVVWNDEASNVFITASPDAATAKSRTLDEDGLVYTIQSAKERVSLSVMDFTPFSTFPIETLKEGSIYWPALTDAVLRVVYARPVTVRLLISQWLHSSQVMIHGLKLLKGQADLCVKCRGSLEIRLMQVPGWNQTEAPQSTWPQYSRVNHAKYIVTDERANIGTSNMEWGYFYNTAGTSLNTDNKYVKDALQQIFDRNWNSPYAKPLP